MNKVCFLLFFALSVAFNGFSQTTTATDFYAGKWEINITGSPRGDVKFLTDLVRKDGKLTGVLRDISNGDNADSPKRPITKVEESATKLVLYFESSQGGDASMELTKADDTTLKGSVMGYDAVAKRLK